VLFARTVRGSDRAVPDLVSQAITDGCARNASLGLANATKRKRSDQPIDCRAPDLLPSNDDAESDIRMRVDVRFIEVQHVFWKRPRTKKKAITSDGLLAACRRS
jgi:hypothetical protein